MNNFYQKYLDIFKSSLDITQPILRTNLEEDSTIEFKKSLHTRGESIDKDYLKTISGFANNKGGVIIMGIEPNTKELVGIKPQFENLDNRYVSTSVREGLDGSFDYAFYTQRFLDKVIGFLVIKEAATKPVILKVDSSSFRLGEIYYRYPAQTTKILAADLRRILNDEVSRRLQSMIGNISNLVELGDSAAILNTSSGEIQAGSTGPKLVLDEKILDKLNLIKEGQFSETDGSPAYVIKGNIEVGNVEVVEKAVPSIINESDILENFFNSYCDAPKVILEKLVFLNSYYFPIYFFIKEAKLTKKGAIEYLKSINKPDVVKLTRDRLIERLNKFDYRPQGTIIRDIKDTLDQNLDIDTQVKNIKAREKVKYNETQIERTLFYNTLCMQQEIHEHILSQYNKRIIEAFSNISSDILIESSQYYLSVLTRLNKVEKSHDVITLFRKVICYLDQLLYSKSLSIQNS
ncbi:ATP-binding protein [Pontibacter ruber]|uniref:ATP-binding protein n=1 Tax=Pontibacter ruber TaxID=1343895 RepID=A0ABW5D0T2_9BACT|nr:ATP-binding protein [Pontibacter ruber]